RPALTRGAPSRLHDNRPGQWTLGDRAKNAHKPPNRGACPRVLQGRHQRCGSGRIRSSSCVWYGDGNLKRAASYCNLFREVKKKILVGLSYCLTKRSDTLLKIAPRFSYVVVCPDA